MSNELKLGQIITDPNAARDAVHIAVIPLTTDLLLQPGNRIGVVPGTDKATTATTAVGIVDPFLQDVVKPGERFWCYLFPGTITSLRHDWTHPLLPTPEHAEAVALMSDRAFSERWLRDYAARMNCYDDPDTAFANLLNGLRSGDLYAHGSTLYGEHDLDDADELKRHAEFYLGIKIRWDDFTFRCGC